MAIFTGFKPQAMQKIAGRLGYKGSMEDFDNFLEQNPEKKRQMVVYEEAAQQMARGGVVKMQEGGDTPDPNQKTIGDVTADRLSTPALPQGATTTPVGVPIAQEQMIVPSAGQVSGTVSVPTTMAQTTMATQPTVQQANLMDSQSVAEQV